jgi:hypothetical protein
MTTVRDVDLRSDENSNCLVFEISTVLGELIICIGNVVKSDRFSRNLNQLLLTPIIPTGIVDTRVDARNFEPTEL